MDELQIDATVRLHRPQLIVAFSGWSNAADVATRTADYMRTKLDATPCGQIPVDPYIDYTTARPTVQIKNGEIEDVSFPTNAFYACRRPGEAHDLLFFIGVEPAFRWGSFLTEFVEACRRWNVSLVMCLGGLYDRVPHTRPARLSALASEKKLRTMLQRMNCHLTDYSGPSSIHGPLAARLQDAGIPSLSLWGHVPSYAQVAWNPRLTEALLRAVSQIVHVTLNLDEVTFAGDYLDEMLRKAMAENSELRDHLAELEHEYDDEHTQDPLPLSDSVIREVEELLRQQRNGPADEE